MNEKESKPESWKDGPEVLNDIHMISEELEALYNHYSRRIKSVSEDLSRERGKHKVYQSEIAENHHTIQVLTEQIEYLLQDIERKQQLYIHLQNELKEESFRDHLSEEINSVITKPEAPVEDIHEEDLWEVSDYILPTAIPEIRVIYESTHSQKKSLLENVKNEAISLLVEANEYFVSESNKSIEVEVYSNAFPTYLEWIRKQRKQYTVGINERWYSKMWKYLWGKEEENNHPEILKKLDLIEEQLVSYASKFNEVKESLNQSNSREETTQNYLQKISQLHDQLKKIEGHYEEELHALKDQIEEFKQRESDLERQMTLLNEKYTGKQKERNQREIELEQELVKLRQGLKSQSNKKNDLYNKMKQQNSVKKQTPQVNPQFEEYGNIPLASEAKRTMFNPNKYIR
ncbi:hypothetical protein [Bacillus sp. es.034]|uniref:hypothetical protein n=1 Tax=Bacillus sp. es.034 TaxID=1761763 RepID=UPI000BFA5CBC|nr:hypothetical protein [Bacillus sp. es.034]PFG06635.1 hypothetical protein ATG71_3500 [Bacillus sp. es.034]